MAVTTLTTYPNDYSPVYGDLWFQLTSTSYALTNFKYVFDLQKVSVGGVTSSLGRYKVPPSVAGYGLYNSSRVLQTQLTYDLNPAITSYQAPNSLTSYNINYGFEYNPNKAFVSTFGTTASKLGLSFSTPHSFLVGDVIQISKDDKTVNYEYDGTASVAATTTYAITTDKTYLVPYPNESGAIISFLRLENISRTLNAFNGVRPYELKAFNYGTIGKYLHTGTQSEGGSTYSLTNYSFIDGYYPTYEGSKTIELNDVETTSYLVDRSYSYRPDLVGIQLYSALGTSSAITSTDYFTYSINVNTAYKRIDIGTGPLNITNALGFNIFTQSSNLYYMVCLQSSTVPLPGRPMIPLSAINSYGLRYYKIKDYDPIANCSPYPKIRLAFVNTLGGIDYFTFNFKSVNTMNTEKTYFKRELDFNYTVGDRQDFVLSQRATETYTISTDFLNDNTASWLKELIKSTEVYVITADGSDISNIVVTKLPILIMDSSFQVKTKLNDKSIAITLTYKTAYPINTAQG
jgi:hypothetical protein